jgi:DNA-binding GntR family transcriptional regulator
VISEESTSLMEKAYISIKNMVFLQKIVPGQKLVYRELSKLLDMSATPVQVALARLKSEGFVELVPNVGYFVKKIVPKEIEDLFDMRRILEVYTVGLAIQYQNVESLRKLEEIIQTHKKYIIQIYDRKKLLLDADVHLQIAGMANNLEIVKQLKRIYEHIYLRSRVELLPPQRLSLTPSEHEKIFQMIKSKNVESAQKILCKHIEEAKNVMMLTLSKDAGIISFGSLSI